MRRESRRLFTFGLLILLALALLGLVSRSGLLRPAISAVMAPLAPLASLLTQGAEAATGLGEEPEDVQTLRERTRELEHTVAELQVEIVRLREIERDYYRLAGLVSYTAEHPDQSIITADVVARDTSSYLRWVVVNRGARDGIQIGNPVITDLGLVGRVEEVAANTAWVRLTIDPGSVINARLQNAHAEGLVRGQLRGNLRMEQIAQEALVEVGDLVLTSGLGGALPPDIVIGQVASIRQQPAELFQEADVRTTVDFESLEIVSVITSFQPIDLSAFDDITQGEGVP
jgi:rod shape-determining protein MreC